MSVHDVDNPFFHSSICDVALNVRQTRRKLEHFHESVHREKLQEQHIHQHLHHVQINTIFVEDLGTHHPHWHSAQDHDLVLTYPVLIIQSQQTQEQNETVTPPSCPSPQQSKRTIAPPTKSLRSFTINTGSEYTIATITPHEAPNTPTFLI